MNKLIKISQHMCRILNVLGFVLAIPISPAWIVWFWYWLNFLCWEWNVLIYYLQNFTSFDYCLKNEFAIGHLILHSANTHCVPYARHHGSLKGSYSQESIPFIFVSPFTVWEAERNRIKCIYRWRVSFGK